MPSTFRGSHVTPKKESERSLSNKKCVNGVDCCIGSRPSDHYFCSVCLSVCLCRVFLSRLWSDFDQIRTHVICHGTEWPIMCWCAVKKLLTICLGLVVSPRVCRYVQCVAGCWSVKRNLMQRWLQVCCAEIGRWSGFNENFSHSCKCVFMQKLVICKMCSCFFSG